MTKPTWIKELYEILSLTGPASRIEEYKENYPGNYQIEEGYDAGSGRFYIKLVFDTPQDETVFRLRYD